MIAVRTEAAFTSRTLNLFPFYVRTGIYKIIIVLEAFTEKLIYYKQIRNSVKCVCYCLYVIPFFHLFLVGNRIITGPSTVTYSIGNVPSPEQYIAILYQGVAGNQCNFLYLFQFHSFRQKTKNTLNRADYSSQILKNKNKNKNLEISFSSERPSSGHLI